MMTVFHGGYKKITVPEIRAGLFNKDFGNGFYCTNLQAQAERWAKRFDTPTVNVYEYAQGGMLNVRTFEEMTDEWLDFIAHCRKGVPHDYDIVTGAMANDQVWNYVADYLSGILTRKQFWVLAEFNYPTHQISFNTKKALAHLQFIKSYEVRI